jgi:OOP family OmpA-OmpF porin
LSDATMTLTGEVNGPEQAAAVDAALAVLQTGTATITKEITLLDDGKPAAYQVIYAADTGARVTGKLPKGLDALAIATAMGLTTLTNNATTALLGDPVDAGFLTTFNGWMDNVETLTLTVGPTARTVNATAHAGIDATALKTALAAGLAGFDVAVTTIIPKGANGQTRINAASGLNERFMGGYWISVPNFNTTLVGCQTQAETVLENATITFVTNSSDLEPSAVAVINSLASIMAVCAETAGLRAVIGGHTDSSGDAVANLALSQQRAMAVRLELIARGVPETALTALGYGSEKPIADNTTEEGKAKNRRTTIVWSE